MSYKYLVRAGEAPGYSPANHTGTLNRRLVGAENVGARHLEVVLGVIERNGGALPHAHPGIEQVCYLLEGSARAEVCGESFDMEPGDTCFFPANEMHVFTVTSEQPARLLVIYSPPYAESNARTADAKQE